MRVRAVTHGIVLYLFASGAGAVAAEPDERFLSCLHDSEPVGAAFWACADDLDIACKPDIYGPSLPTNSIGCFRGVVSRFLGLEAEYAELVAKRSRNLLLAARVAGFRRDIRIGDAECAYLDEIADIGSNAKNTDFRLLSLMECRAHFYASAYWQNIVHERVE